LVPSTQTTRFPAFLGHVIRIVGTFPGVGPSATAPILVRAQSVHALVARLATIDAHVIDIVVAFALGGPQLALGLDAHVRIREGFRALGVFVLAAAKATRVLAIETHIGLVARTLALQRPILTLLVPIRTGRYRRPLTIPTKPARLSAILAHVIRIAGAFALAGPKVTFGSGALSKIRNVLTGIILVRACRIVWGVFACRVL